MSHRRTVPILVIAVVATLFAVALVPSTSAVVTTTYGAIVKKPQSTSSELSMVIFDVTLSAATTDVNSGIGFWDCDADGIDNTDPWYLSINGDATVDTAEIRLSAVPSTQCGTSFSAGTVVTSADADRGKTLTRTGFAVCFIDSILPAGDAYNPGEQIYISHEDADCTDDLVVDNIFLNTGTSATGVTTGSAGSRATTADSDPDGLAFPVTQFEIYDLDNNGAYSAGDGVYLDLPYGAGTTLGFASPGDIRMTGHLSESFGSIVEKDDVDVVYALVDLGFTVRRETADAATCTGSTPPSIYLSAGATVAINDIRLTQTGSFSAGSVVATGDSDIGVATTDITGQVDMVDLNDNNNVFDDDDFVWYDGNNDNDIDQDEVRLSKSGSRSAAACVSSSDGDRGLSSDGAITTALVKYFDVDRSGGYTSGDLVYLDMDDGVAGDGGDGYVSVGDIKWSTSTQLSGITFGDPTDNDDIDVTYVLDIYAAQTTGVFCFEDENGGGTYGAGEPVYLRVTSATACGTGVNLAPGDLRLTSTSSGSLAAGAYVSGASNDNGHSVRAIAGTPAFRFFNIGSDLNTLQDVDVLYLDSDGSGKISVGDVVITGVSSHGAAGEIVTASDTAILNGDLVAFTAGTCGTAQNYCIRGFDVDGDRTASVNDIAVWDDGLLLGGSRFITPGDVYLSGGSGTTSSFSGLGQSPGSSGGGSSGGGSTTPTQPVPAFTCTGTMGGMQVSVDARGSSDPDGTITKYEWDWGNGKTAQGSTIVHLYDNPGRYTIRLTVTDNSGNVRSLQRTIEIPIETDTCVPAPDTPTQPTTPTEPTAPTAPTTPTQPTAPTDPTDPTDADDDDEEDPVGTPGPGLAVVLLALFGLLAVAVRRRA